MDSIPSTWYFGITTFIFFLRQLSYPVIWKEQVYWILWEQLSAAIVLIRGWKPFPQVSFFVT
jgi:hypothetical protein